MTEVSNKFIMGLLTVAVLITIVGTIVSVNRLAALQENYGYLTAAATTATGQTNLTITASTAITNQKALIDFGSGNVNASCDFCQMDSNGVTASTATTNGVNTSDGSCCGAWNYTQTAGFLLENTGNANISVGYTCSGNCTYGLFIGGSRPGGFGGLEIKVTSNNVASQTTESGGTDSASSCVGGGTLYRSGSWNITNSSSYSGALTEATGGLGEAYYVQLSSLGHWLCGNYTASPLMSDNTKDAAVVDINVSIASDSPATSVRSSFILTFNATSQ